MTDKEKFAIKMLKFIDEHDLYDDIYWTQDLDFYVLCNDFFWWACADGEDVTEESLPILEQALKDSKHYMGPELYCCRMRKMRPQGACYRRIPKDEWELFNACGEYRPVDFGNPYEIGEYK